MKSKPKPRFREQLAAAHALYKKERDRRRDAAERLDLVFDRKQSERRLEWLGVRDCAETPHIMFVSDREWLERITEED